MASTTATASGRPAAEPATLAARLTLWRALALLVAASAGLRLLVGSAKETPAYMPDEYLYAELGRSLAESGRPLVRETAAHFPALLEPLLLAPAWLADDVATSYAIVLAADALLMSLVAVPVALLARRAGLSTGATLLCALLSVAVPDLLYASWVVAEPLAYPLALAALAAGTAALGGGGRRAQSLFVLFAVAAAAARTQFVALPLCYVAATIVVGARSGSVRRALREHALVLGLLVAPTLLVLAFRPASVLGIYQGLDHVDLDPVTLVGSIARSALGLALASGWVLVPGALLGLAVTLARPRSPVELAFGALAAATISALLLQASLYGEPHLVQERYVFYGAPLLAILFCLGAHRIADARRAYRALVVAVSFVALLIPFSTLTDEVAIKHSAALFAVLRLERLTSAGAPSVVALALAALTVAAAVLARRVAATAALTLACGLCALAAAGATDLDLRNTRNVAAQFLPADPSWVDAAGLRDVTLLRGAATRTDTLTQLFWNRSVDRVLLLPGAMSPDGFAASRLAVGADGTLLAGSPVRGAVVADDLAGTVLLRDALRAGGSPTHRLWIPRGDRAQLALFAPGFLRTGWLSPRAAVTLWPAAAGGALRGTLALRLSSPRDTGRAVRVKVTASDGSTRAVRLAPGERTGFTIAVCSTGPWQARIEASETGRVGAFAVALLAGLSWRENTGACGA